MPAKSRVDLLLERFEPFVAVKNMQLAEKRLTVLLATKFGDDLRTLRLRDFGERNFALLQASFDIGIRPAVGRQRELTNPGRVQCLEGVEPFSQH